MSELSPPATAVGRLSPDGPWVGLRHRLAAQASDERYELVVGRRDGVHALRPPAHGDILAAALAYFEDALYPAPVEMEAIQADLADAVRWLASSEPSAHARALLEAATDAIDDGLAAEEVIARLAAAAPPEVRRDPIAYLRRRIGAAAGAD